MRKSIAIDMDQVLADFVGKAVKAMNERLNLGMTREEFFKTSIQKLHPEHMNEFISMMNEPDFFRDLELLDPNSVEVIKELNETYDIYIATAAMHVPGSFLAKYDWLREHFPFLNTNYFIFCGDKKVVKADYLIDDSVGQLKSFTGQGILFDQPNNASVTEYPRVKNWQEVLEYFQQLAVVK